MTLDFEAQTSTDRHRRRDLQRDTVAAVPQNSAAAAFLVAEAGRLLEVQFRMEDALLEVVEVAENGGSDEGGRRGDGGAPGAANLREAIPLCQEIGARLVLAAQTSIDFVSEAMGLVFQVK